MVTWFFSLEDFGGFLKFEEDLFMYVLIHCVCHSEAPFNQKTYILNILGSVGSDWREHESWVGGPYSVFDHVMATQA